MKLDGKVISFLGGLVSAAFGAGATATVWATEHPTRSEIANALGCEKLDKCSIAEDLKEARLALKGLAEDIKTLRRDKALDQFEREISKGVPPAEAFRRALE